MRIAAALSFLLAVPLVACDATPDADGGAGGADASPRPDAGRRTADAGRSGPDGGRDAGSDGGADAGPPASATFESLYRTILVPHCGDGRCHQDGGVPSAEWPRLQFSDATRAYAALVGRPTECRGPGYEGTRVVPGDPEASWVLRVASMDLCGLRHPSFLLSNGFEEDDLAALEAWIVDGAP